MQTTRVFLSMFKTGLDEESYKTAASEAWGNLLDHAARPDLVAAYQHNQTDLEFACAGHRAGNAAGGLVAKWEGPSWDAAMAAR
jgi:hypothetical protein